MRVEQTRDAHRPIYGVAHSACIRCIYFITRWCVRVPTDDYAYVETHVCIAGRASCCICITYMLLTSNSPLTSSHPPRDGDDAGTMDVVDVGVMTSADMMETI